MPRIKRSPDEEIQPHHPRLVKELAQELTAEGREFGQPWIEETEFVTRAVRVRVIWDKWDNLSDQERSQVTLQAYEKVEGKDFRDRIALAVCLTFPEAREMGLLPYRIEPAVRSGDSVTLDQCLRAMRANGASNLFDPRRPQLLFATKEEAESCRNRLTQQLPGSEEVWLIEKDFSPKDSSYSQ